MSEEVCRPSTRLCSRRDHTVLLTCRLFLKVLLGIIRLHTPLLQLVSWSCLDSGILEDTRQTFSKSHCMSYKMHILNSTLVAVLGAVIT